MEILKKQEIFVRQRELSKASIGRGVMVLNEDTDQVGLLSYYLKDYQWL